MSASYTVGDYLIARLRELGIEHVFGVPGDFAFPLLDMIEDDPAIAWIGSCTELNATYSADGYARTHGVGAVVGACGVLELGGAGGIAGAWAEQVPMVVIGCAPSAAQLAAKTMVHHSLRGRFDRYGAMLEPVTAAQAVLTAEDARQQIDATLETCWAAKAPVYLYFPSDVQLAAAEPPSAPLRLLEPTSDPAALDRCVAAIVERVAAAERPVLIIDFLAERFGLVHTAQDLAARAGIACTAPMAGRMSSLDETRPEFIGTYLPSREQSTTQRYVEAADLLLRLMPSPSDTAVGVALPSLHEPRMIDLQADHATVGGKRFSRVTPKDVLARLITALPPRPLVYLPVPRTSPTTFDPVERAPITQDRMWEGLSAFLDQDDVLAVDYGTCQEALMLNFPVRTRLLCQATWDAIGWTTPMVAGARLGDPDHRYVQVIGDGAFQETAQEVSTLIRHRMPIITVLIDNTTYQVENTTHPDAPVHKAYNELHAWSYAEVVAAMTTSASPLTRRVTTEDEFAAALSSAGDAHRDGRYSFIEVVVAPDDVPLQLARMDGIAH